MRRFTFLVLLCWLSTPALCHDLSDRRFVTGQFDRFEKVSLLPTVIQKAIQDGVHDAVCPGMADRGQEFSSGCVVEAGRPCRRLIIAGRASDLWFVLYEAGGIAHARHMLVIQLNDGQVTGTWSYLRLGTSVAIGDLLRHVKQADPCLVTPPRERYEGDEIETCFKMRGA
jgi:hypothetical protein